MQKPHVFLHTTLAKLSRQKLVPLSSEQFKPLPTLSTHGIGAAVVVDAAIVLISDETGVLVLEVGLVDDPVGLKDNAILLNTVQIYYPRG